MSIYRSQEFRACRVAGELFGERARRLARTGASDRHQDEAPAPGEAADSAASASSIVVTGSRIARRDYVATSSIATVDADLIEQSSQINLEANLNKLPQFAAALTQFSTGDFQANANNTIGVSTVSLRQLGSNRNLVLLDGRRGMPVERHGGGRHQLDPVGCGRSGSRVITGGASSTYGADAVGGVVNFILKDELHRLRGRRPGRHVRARRRRGVPHRGARRRRARPAAAATSMLGMEHYNREAILRVDRPWYQDLFRNPNVTGSEFFLNENTWPSTSLQAGRRRTIQPKSGGAERAVPEQGRTERGEHPRAVDRLHQ